MNNEFIEGKPPGLNAEKHSKRAGGARAEVKTPGLSRDNILRLYAEHAGSVYNFFVYSTGDIDAAEDLVGDVFVKIIGKSGYFHEQKGDSRVWLFAVARNTLRDYIKAKRRTRPRISLEEAEHVSADRCDDPQESAELKAALSALKEALTTLDKRAHSLVSLKYGAGLGNKDIAELTGLTEKNVGVILCRALTKLRKQLGDDFYE